MKKLTLVCIGLILLLVIAGVVMTTNKTPGDNQNAVTVYKAQNAHALLQRVVIYDANVVSCAKEWINEDDNVIWQDQLLAEKDWTRFRILNIAPPVYEITDDNDNLLYGELKPGKVLSAESNKDFTVYYRYIDGFLQSCKNLQRLPSMQADKLRLILAAVFLF